MATAAPASNNKRKEAVPSHIHYAKDLVRTFRDIYFSGVQKGKTHDNKYVSIQASEMDAKHRITIIVDGPGFIPSFGVDVNKQFGSTYLIFPVCNKDEQAGLKALDDHIRAMAGTDVWWPERAVKNGRKAPGPDVLDEGFMPILKPEKEKKTGDGKYPPKVKVAIPLDSKGDPAKGVKVVDANGKPISIHSLPGRKFSRVVFELNFVYFKGTEVGVKKVLKYVRVSDDAGDNPDMFDDLSYLDAPDAAAAPQVDTQRVDTVATPPEDVQVAKPTDPQPEPVPQPVVSNEEDLLALLGEDDAGRHKNKKARK